MDRSIRLSDSTNFTNIITVKRLQATDYKGARLVITSFSQGETVTISTTHPYHEKNVDIALEYLLNKGITVTSYGYGKDSLLILTTDCNNSIK